MTSFLVLLRNFLRAFRAGLQEERFRGVALYVAVLLASGTIFYSTVEGWRLLDSLFFSVTTLTTVGYGNLVPVTDLGKIFTIIYIFMGIGAIVLFANELMRSHLKRSRRRRRNRR